MWDHRGEGGPNSHHRAPNRPNSVVRTRRGEIDPGDSENAIGTKSASNSHHRAPNQPNSTGRTRRGEIDPGDSEFAIGAFFHLLDTPGGVEIMKKLVGSEFGISRVDFPPSGSPCRV